MNGNILRRLREDKGLSQEEVANRLGLSQKTISSWEKDRTNPKLSQLKQLCDIYECSLESVTGVRNHDLNDISLVDIIVKLDQLSTVELETIRDKTTATIEQRQRLLRYEEELAKYKNENPDQ